MFKWNGVYQSIFEALQSACLHIDQDVEIIQMCPLSYYNLLLHGSSPAFIQNGDAWLTMRVCNRGEARMVRIQPSREMTAQQAQLISVNILEEVIVGEILLSQ